VASNGLEVLSALRRRAYDVVLMDVQMPEMDGLEAARQIGRQVTPGHRPRIVALTANAMAEDREAGRAAGMDDYLSKPVQVKELQAALQRCGQWVLERDRSTGPRPEEPPPSAAATIDPEALALLKQMAGDGGPGMLRDLLALFRADAPPLQAAMRAAVAGRDAEALRRSAHSLKGVAANLGAKALAALCAELERMGRDGAVGGAEGLLAEVERQYHDACVALEAEIR
jgi:CheY-like chemotaxis protein/HPt (histidine-containing phosphotransfer) domain-containing protein